MIYFRARDETRETGDNLCNFLSRDPLIDENEKKLIASKIMECNITIKQIKETRQFSSFLPS
jgi:hypothetical protein